MTLQRFESGGHTIFFDSWVERPEDRKRIALSGVVACCPEHYAINGRAVPREEYLKKYLEVATPQ